MNDLTLTDAEVSVVASALYRQHEHLSKMRGVAERRLADPGTLGAVDWGYAAAREERSLAALDSVVTKLPEWVAVFMAEMKAS